MGEDPGHQMKNLPGFILAFAAMSLQAQPISTFAGLPGAPMRLGFGSQGIGMGNAMVATPTQLNIGYYNPALAAFQERPAAIISVGFLSLDRSLNFVNYSTPLPPSAGLSLSIINTGVSELQGRDGDGRPTEQYSTSENAFFLSFGARVDTNLTVGISTKILYYKLFSELSSTTVGFDLGAVYRLSNELAFGVCLQDLGSKYKWDSSALYGLDGNNFTEHFPVRKRIGMSYAPEQFPVLTAIEFEYTARVALLKLGAQVSLTNSFVVRAGLDHLGLTESQVVRPSFGFTVQTATGSWNSSLSYAIVIEPYAAGSIHLLSLGIEFR